MLSHSITTRGVYHGVLFGPPRFVPREEASGIYDGVCNALRYDDFVLRYSSSDQEEHRSSKAFTIQLDRRQGRGGMRVTLENKGIPNPIRLLVENEWPANPEEVREGFDLAQKAIFDALKGSWQIVWVETRICAQCTTPANDALKYVNERIARVPEGYLAAVGGERLNYTRLQFEAETQGDDPGRALRVEVLREDPRSLYIEVISQWPQVKPGRPEIRDFSEEPSFFVNEATEYLESVLIESTREG